MTYYIYVIKLKTFYKIISMYNTIFFKIWNFQLTPRNMLNQIFNDHKLHYYYHFEFWQEKKDNLVSVHHLIIWIMWGL